MTVSELMTIIPKGIEVTLADENGNEYATYMRGQYIEPFHADDKVLRLNFRVGVDPIRENDVEIFITAITDIQPDFDYISRCW